MSDAEYQSAQSSRASKLIGIAADRNKLLASKSKIAGLNIGTQPRPRGFGDQQKTSGDFGSKTPMGLGDGAMMTRTAPSRSPLFFTYFARRNRRERRPYYFIGSARGQHLARADRVAKRFRALFR